MTLFLVPGAPVAAGPGDDCASVTTRSSTRTDAQASTQDGYGVSVSASGMNVQARALSGSCVGEAAAKSSELVFDTLAFILERAPPLP